MTSINALLAERLGIKETQLALYSRGFLGTVQGFAQRETTKDPNLAITEALKFYATDRMFEQRHLMTIPTQFGEVIFSGLMNYLKSLPSAYAQLLNNFKQDRDFQHLSYGTAKGLDLLSHRTAIELAKQTTKLTNPVHMTGADIDGKALEYARRGLYSRNELETGIYESEFARQQDEDNSRPLEKYPDLKQQYMTAPSRELFDFVFKHLMQDVGSPENHVKVRPDVHSTHGFVEVSPFKLPDNVPENGFHSVSLSLLGLLSDEGRAHVIGELNRALRPGGMLYTGLYSGIQSTQGETPQTRALLEDKFEYTSTPAGFVVGAYRKKRSAVSYQGQKRAST